MARTSRRSNRGAILLNVATGLMVFIGATAFVVDYGVMEQDVIAMQEIFAFQQTGINSEGKVVGAFRATGVRPKCADKIAAAGMTLPMDMFSHVHPVNQPAGERRF